MSSWQTVVFDDDQHKNTKISSTTKARNRIELTLEHPTTYEISWVYSLTGIQGQIMTTIDR